MSLGCGNDSEELYMLGAKIKKQNWRQEKPDDKTGDRGT